MTKNVCNDKKIFLLVPFYPFDFFFVSEIHHDVTYAQPFCNFIMVIEGNPFS